MTQESSAPSVASGVSGMQVHLMFSRTTFRHVFKVHIKHKGVLYLDPTKQAPGKPALQDIPKIFHYTHAGTSKSEKSPALLAPMQFE
ncbi:hypothetical protein I79_016351 [Cricetulus griseus]|uniref:Uncharacterized protein n=1 Tax=Cricetulus griseus TaxID=10029 RepID=G3HZ56_CRIGR|nr:hypothetical protein I79_016351 [Cricetulus griseus]